MISPAVADVAKRSRRGVRYSLLTFALCVFVAAVCLTTAAGCATPQPAADRIRPGAQTHEPVEGTAVTAGSIQPATPPSEAVASRSGSADPSPAGGQSVSASTEGTVAQPGTEAVASIVDRTLARMSLRELIGQHFIMWLTGRDEVDARAAYLVQQAKPAGIILYPWNFSSRSAATSMITGYQSEAERAEPGIRLLVCADQEGGRVATFRFDSFVEFPSQYDLGQFDDPLFMKAAGYISGVELRSLGVNMELGPVVDLSTRPDASIIGDRSIGPDPARVSRLAAAYIEGAHAAGLISVAKHFPGHGTTRVDSHGGLPVVDLSREQLAPHLAPFRVLVDHGVDAVMTAHILFPKIDPANPVTMSKTFVHDLLRGELGFDGVVMSDGLEMGALALNYPVEATIERSLNAGVDLLLLYTGYDVLKMVNIVQALVDDGRVSEDTIRAGARRVLTLKARYGLLGSGATDQP